MKTLYIEDHVTTEDFSDRYNAENLQDWNPEFTAEVFDKFEHIEMLHLRTSRLQYHAMNLEACSKVKELRLDLTKKGRFRDHDVAYMFNAMRSLPDLQILDLRYPYDCCELFEPFVPHWPMRIPQVKTVAILYQCLPNALSAKREDCVHFELLADSERAIFEAQNEASVEVEREIAAGASEKITNKRDIGHRRADSQALKDIKEARNQVLAVDRALTRVEQHIEMVQIVKRIFDSRRTDGRVENRSISIVDCQWKQDGVGSAWLADSEDHWQFYWGLKDFIDDLKREDREEGSFESGGEPILEDSVEQSEDSGEL